MTVKSVYWRSPKLTLYQGNCLDILPTIPNSAIDLILTDPPYHVTKKDNITGDKNFKIDRDYLEWLEQIAGEWQRILKPNGSLYCFCSPKISAKIEVMLDKYFNILGSIVWTKPNDPGYDGWKQKTKKESLRNWYFHSERIIFGEATSKENLDLPAFSVLLKKSRVAAGISAKELTEAIGEYREVNHGGAVSNWETGRNVPTFEQYQKIKYFLSKYPQVPPLPNYQEIIRPFTVTADVAYTDIWDFPTVKPYQGKHPAEKPIDLINHIIKASSNPDNVVLDCFAGSGVVGQVANQLERQAILIEIEAHWCQKIALRCADISSLTNLPKGVNANKKYDWQNDSLHLFKNFKI